MEGALAARPLEPPDPVAHDDWVPSKLKLEKNQRNFVRLALDKLRQELESRK